MFIICPQDPEDRFGFSSTPRQAQGGERNRTAGSLQVGGDIGGGDRTPFEDAYSFSPSPLSSPVKGEEIVVEENFSLTYSKDQ
jgi:hypothetical protein